MNALAPLLQMQQQQQQNPMMMNFMNMNPMMNRMNMNPNPMMNMGMNMGMNMNMNMGMGMNPMMHEQPIQDTRGNQLYGNTGGFNSMPQNQQIKQNNNFNQRQPQQVAAPIQVPKVIFF